MRNTFLVTYDICQDKRLAKVHKTMRGFGDHLQYSVFECQLTQADLARCRHLLSTIIDHRKDRVLFVDLGPAEGRGDTVEGALRHETIRGRAEALRPANPQSATDAANVEQVHARSNRQRGIDPDHAVAP
jgi:CRISPR-associated protein Cas2